MITKYTTSCINCAITTYYIMKTKVIQFIESRRKKHDYFSTNLFSNDEEQPATILSSEEIGKMISKQSKYTESHPNVNEYKIVMDKDKGDPDESDELKTKDQKINEIKNDLGDFEFEEDDQGKPFKNETIEELKSTILNDNTE